MIYDDDWVRQRLSQSRVEQSRSMHPKYWDYKWFPAHKRDFSNKTFADYKRMYARWRQKQIKDTIIDFPDQARKQRSHYYSRNKFARTTKGTRWWKGFADKNSLPPKNPNWWGYRFTEN